MHHSLNPHTFAELNTFNTQPCLLLYLPTLEADRQIGGSLVAVNGSIISAHPKKLHIDDVLDYLAEPVQSKGDRVDVLSANHMPSNSGLASNFRH